MMQEFVLLLLLLLLICLLGIMDIHAPAGNRTRDYARSAVASWTFESVYQCHGSVYVTKYLIGWVILSLCRARN